MQYSQRELLMVFGGTLNTIKVIGIGLAAIVLLALAGAVSNSLSHIADVTGPQAQADANTALLMGEVNAKAEGARQEVLAREQALLQIEREKATQEIETARELSLIRIQSVSELALIEADLQKQLAEIEAERIAAVSAGTVAWVLPVIGTLAAAAVISLLVFMMGRSGTKVAEAYAIAQLNKARVAGLLPVAPDTMRLPAVMTTTEKGVPVLVNPDTGEVIPITGNLKKADERRLQFLSAQNTHVGTEGRRRMAEDVPEPAAVVLTQKE
jgi:hypothetical protein